MLTARDLGQLGIDPERRKFRTLLDDLQGNILKSHGRDHARLIFFTLERGKARAARAWIRALAAGRVTSARRQLSEAADYRKKMAGRNRQVPETLFCTFSLSATGYRALGADLRLPSDAKFRAGMKRSRASLRDPEPGAWEEHYRGEIHGLIFLAHDSSSALVRFTTRIRRELRPFTEAVWVERGDQLRRGKQAIEHFGYADGVSQPQFLKGDIDKENSGGNDAWDPSAPLRLVLARDPNGRTVDAFGSYLVYRKLEQDVPLFEEKERDMTRALQVRSPLVVDPMAHLAGAFMIGRFPNGTPVTLQGEAAQKGDPENNFTYADDPRGSHCPFQAHTRAANPRTLASRRQRIVRRGIPYGRRNPRGSRGNPEQGLGLLFMCLQRSIGNQFERVQRRMNGQEGHAKDPITGQGSGGAPPLWPAPYATPSRLQYPPLAPRLAWQERSPVRLLGGEYFFAPSLSFLTGL